MTLSITIITTIVCSTTLFLMMLIRKTVRMIVRATSLLSMTVQSTRMTLSSTK